MAEAEAAGAQDCVAAPNGAGAAAGAPNAVDPNMPPAQADSGQLCMNVTGQCHC